MIGYTEEQKEQAVDDLGEIFASLDDVHEVHSELCMAFAQNAGDKRIRAISRKLARKLEYTFILGEAAEDKLSGEKQKQ